MNTTTRTYPRTLEQAFGPSHRGGIYEPRPPIDRADRIVLIASVLVAVFTFGLLVAS